MEAVAPPGVAVLHIAVYVAEGVHEAAAQQAGHLLPLLVGKAGVLPVGLGIFQVYFSVRHVQVAAVHQRFFRVQLQQVFPQVVLPLHPVRKPLQAVLTVGRVAAHEVKRRIFRRDDAPLVAVLVAAEVVGHVQRLAFCQNGRAGVALFVGGVKKAVVARQVKHRLLRLQFRLLQAEHVRILAGHIVQKALAQRSPQAVHIPAYQFHEKLLRVFYHSIAHSAPKPNKNIDKAALWE